MWVEFCIHVYEAESNNEAFLEILVQTSDSNTQRLLQMNICMMCVYLEIIKS